MHTDTIVVVPPWVLLAYLVSGVCFILALRGLSSPETSRRGNLTGMVGMAIAVVTTLITHVPREQATGTGWTVYAPASLPLELPVDWTTVFLIFAAILIGGGIGLVT